MNQPQSSGSSRTNITAFVPRNANYRGNSLGSLFAERSQRSEETDGSRTKNTRLIQGRRKRRNGCEANLEQCFNLLRLSPDGPRTAPNDRLGGDLGFTTDFGERDGNRHRIEGRLQKFLEARGCRRCLGPQPSERIEDRTSLWRKPGIQKSEIFAHVFFFSVRFWFWCLGRLSEFRL